MSITARLHACGNASPRNTKRRPAGSPASPPVAPSISSSPSVWSASTRITRRCCTWWASRKPPGSSPKRWKRCNLGQGGGAPGWFRCRKMPVSAHHHTPLVSLCSSESRAEISLPYSLSVAEGWKHHRMSIGYGRLIFVKHGNAAQRHDTIPEEWLCRTQWSSP
jgi:hypothetical protein